VTLNARVWATSPQVVQACADAGWELNAHGFDQVPMHKLDDQKAVINKSVAIIAKFWGRPPRGWFGPGLTQTFDTLDHLSAAGIEYIGDWVLDDEPVTLKTTHRPVVALPYNFELHDIVMMALQNHPSVEMYRRIMDQFEWLYAESATRPKFMSIAMHPYLSGVPHRIGHVQRAFEEILSRPAVAACSRAKNPRLASGAVDRSPDGAQRNPGTAFPYCVLPLHPLGCHPGRRAKRGDPRQVPRPHAIARQEYMGRGSRRSGGSAGMTTEYV